MVDQSTNRAIQKYCANWNRDKTILESKVLGRWKTDNNVTYELYNNGTGILNNKDFIWNIGESHHILKLSYPDRTTSSYNIKLEGENRMIFFKKNAFQNVRFVLTRQ